MAIKCVKSRYEAEQGKWIKDYVLDGADDVENLPTNVGAGSMAHYGAENVLVAYELAPGGTWVRIV